MKTAKYITFISLLLFLCMTHVYGKADIYSSLVRKVAGVSDNIPVKKMDDFAEVINRKLLKSAVDEDLVKRFGDDVLASSGKRVRAIKTMLKQYDLPPSILHSVDNLDDIGLEYATILAKGSRVYRTTIPDIMLRSKLLKKGGIDMVAETGLHGREFLQSAIRFDAALDAGNIINKTGKKITLVTFVDAMKKGGTASSVFFKEYIRPHWKIWAGSGLFAWYLVDPNSFQNSTGKMTEKGTKFVTETVGTAIAGAITGVGDGAGHATKKIFDSIVDVFLKSENKFFAIIGTLILILLLSLFIRRIRYYVFVPFRWLNSTPATKSAPQKECKKNDEK